MAAVAIVGILASMAVYSVSRSRERANVKSEVADMFAVMRIAEEQYRSEYGEYLASPWYPSDPTGPYDGKDLITNSGARPADWPVSWKQLGIIPTVSEIHCQYRALVSSPNANTGNIEFSLEALCDVDGDGTDTAGFITYWNATDIVEWDE